MIVTIASYFYVFVTSLLHPFHVSVCEIYHNSKTKTLEVSLKIFTDDLELAIQKGGNSNFQLLDQSADQIDEKQIGKYVSEKFKVSINNRQEDLTFLGFEFDQDAVLCYFESGKIKKISEVEIRNSLMTEIFDDQINLTHFQYQDEMKSLKTSKEVPLGKIDASNW